MTALTHARSGMWWNRPFEQTARLWRRLTEAPESITDLTVRRRVRLNSILCLSSLLGGFLGFASVHLGMMHDLNLPTNPVFGIFVICMLLILAAYLLGRHEKTLGTAAVIVVATVLVGNVLAIVADPADFNSYIIYVIVGDIFASMLLPPLSTRITLVITLGTLALYPLFVPEISIFMALRAMGPIFVVSLILAIGVTVRGRDLTTIEQQARLLDVARREAESANKLKGVFLGMVSHELRTPLNNIVGYSDQMLMGVRGELTGDLREAAERINRNGAQLNRMVNDLLMLSRLESGSLAIVQRAYRLADLIADVEASFHELAEEKGLNLVISLDAALPETLHGDYHRIAQIVLNLVSNAIKFTDHGQIAVSIRPGADGEWSAEVIDTGVGIPDEAASRIFERFYQVDSTSKRSHGGAGLGLAIARELAILMGGNITVHTTVNAGSTFTLTLPLTVQDSPQPAPLAGGAP